MVSEEDKRKKSYRVKREVLECIDTSSAHGLPNIFQSTHQPIKVLWTLCFLASTGYCIYALSKTFIDYYRRDVTVAISLERKPSIEFPTVTICNRNPVKFDRLDSNVYDTIFELDIGAAILVDLGFTSLETSNYWLYAAGLIGLKNNITMGNTALNYSFTISDILLNCRFNNIECSQSDFTYYRSFLNGNCYKFNSGKYLNGSKAKIMTSSTPGRTNGLKLELYAGTPERYYQVIRSNGMIIFIHNSSYVPLSDVDGIVLPSGYETNVRLSQTFYKRLPSPYGECIEDLQSMKSFDSELYRSSVALTSVYSQKFCLQLCIQNMIVSACSCYDLYLPQPLNKNVNACSWEVLYSCVRPVYFGYFDLNSDEPEKCIKNCPGECESTNFNLDLSYATFPTPFYAYLLSTYQNIHPEKSAGRTLSNDSDVVKSSVMAVNIYYDDISYSLIEESPAITTDELFGNIGGIIGLCIGASFLTFVEFFEMVYYVVFVLINPKPNKVTQKF